MGCRNREDEEDRRSPSSSLVNDALLLTTIRLVGLSVDVHIKDGSVYSGIFHTARVDDRYAIVLKQAKMVKKGSCKSNVANEDVIGTLVIQSKDLVQVVAKKVVIRADNIARHEAGDDTNQTSQMLVKSSTKKEESLNDPYGSRKNGSHTSSSEPSETVTTKFPNSISTVKDFKLNPGAKTFSPSFSNKKSPTHPTIATGANLTYIPDSYPGVPVARPQPEVEIGPFASHSRPIKYVPCGGNDVQHPIAGYVTNRSQPLRYGIPYHPVQTSPTYVQPSSQNVMVGRVGPVAYVHPVSQDMVPSTSSFSFLTSHQVDVPKHQGTVAAQALQLCVAPPFIGGAGQPPFVLPSHVSVSQSPYPLMRPISVPGSNGFLVSKYY